MGVFDSRPALLLVDQLSNVLVHKLTLFEKRSETNQTRNQRYRVTCVIWAGLQSYGVSIFGQRHDEYRPLAFMGSIFKQF